MHGGEPRVVLYQQGPNDGAYRHTLRTPFKGPDGFTVDFLLCGIFFTVDCTPNQTRVPYLKKLLRANFGDVGWNWLPL